VFFTSNYLSSCSVLCCDSYRSILGAAFVVFDHTDFAGATRRLGMTMDDALALIQRRRPEADPIPSFRQYLREYEARCIAQGTVVSTSGPQSKGPQPSLSAASASCSLPSSTIGGGGDDGNGKEESDKVAAASKVPAASPRLEQDAEVDPALSPLSPGSSDAHSSRKRASSIRDSPQNRTNRRVLACATPAELNDVDDSTVNQEKGPHSASQASANAAPTGLSDVDFSTVNQEKGPHSASRAPAKRSRLSYE
jgi:hypothetical protein